MRKQTTKIPENINTKELRKQLGLSQWEFAERFGFSLGAVQAWEGGHQPSRPTRTLLKIIAINPNVVDQALAN